MSKSITVGVLGTLVSLTAVYAAAQPQDTPLPGWGVLVGRPDLEGWITEATAVAPSLATAERAERVAAAGGAHARAERRPNATLEMDYRTGRTRDATTNGRVEDLAPVVGRAGVSWDLDLFGRVRSEIGAARFAELSARHHLDDRRLWFSAEIASTYASGCLLNDRVRILRAAEAARVAIASYTKSRVHGGLIEPSALDHALALQQAATQQRITAEKDLSTLEARWRYLIPDDVAPPLADSGGLATAIPPPLPSDDTLHAYAINRPDVQAAHALWRAAHHKAGSATRGRLPSIAAVAAAQGEAPSLTQDPDSWTAWAAARITLPLMAPGRRASAKLERERSGLQEALFNDTTQLALQELQQTYRNCTHATAAWRSAEAGAEAMQQSFESAQRRFEAGTIPLPLLEEARLAWLRADETMRMRYADLLHRHISLTKACGGPLPQHDISSQPSGQTHLSP
ncbi:MAG: TolC family protein [Verrucomicrobia bacterium]|nr:TolC family protein [Verrucomicrobiota bacterium]